MLLICAVAALVAGLVTRRWIHLTNLQVRDEIIVAKLWITVETWRSSHGVLPTLEELLRACNCDGFDSRGRPIVYQPETSVAGTNFVLVAVGRDGVRDALIADLIRVADRNIAGEWDADIVRTHDRRVARVK